jgi:integrase
LYTRAREIRIEALNKIGEDCSKFGFHSLRSGGASAAANSDANLDARLVNKHGRWKSPSSADGYIHYSLENQLSVNKSLGL